jgi:molybdopterin synthase sulfur carrier subunit
MAMAQVWLPSLLRDLSGGQTRVSVAGGTIGEVIDALDVAHPGIKARLLEKGRLNPTLQVLVDGKAAMLGLREPVSEQSEVHFVPLIAGGSGHLRLRKQSGLDNVR